MRGSGPIWRALAAARASNLAAAGEAAPRLGTPSATRRTLLKAIAGASTMPLLPGPAQAFTGGRVAIVGGGVAGLSALHHLREASVDATLYEARHRTGGRMATHRPPNGLPFELGGQLVNTDHHDMQALARSFGVMLIDRKHEAHRSLVLAGDRVLSEAELAEGLRPIAAQIAKDADQLDRNHARVAPALDRMSIADYLDRHRALLTAPWARELLEATSRTEYGVEPDQASAIELIFNLPTVNGERVEVLGGADERFVIQNGSSALIEAMTARYATRIATSKRLQRVERRSGGYRLRFVDGDAVEAERVIIAVPAPLMRQIDFALPLPAIWRDFMASVDLGFNEKVQSGTDATPWREPMGTGGELWQSRSADGWALGWDGSVHMVDGVRPVWTWYLGGDEVRTAEGYAPSALAARFAQSAAPAVPGLPVSATGPYARTNWHAQALTLGAYVNFRPGQLTRFARLLCIDSDDPAERQVPHAGGIHFVGEHLSDASPGYMDGAAQTGRVAAEAITGRRLLKHAA